MSNAIIKSFSTTSNAIYKINQSTSHYKSVTASTNQEPPPRSLVHKHIKSNIGKSADGSDVTSVVSGMHSRATMHKLGARRRASLLTFEAVLTGGGEPRRFLYSEHDTIARDHPILGGCQPGPQLRFQTSLAFTSAVAAAATRPERI